MVVVVQYQITPLHRATQKAGSAMAQGDIPISMANMEPLNIVEFNHTILLNSITLGAVL